MCQQRRQRERQRGKDGIGAKLMALWPERYTNDVIFMIKTIHEHFCSQDAYIK